jgi:glycosyltransferase involved in cell wall biosynthesis
VAKTRVLIFLTHAENGGTEAIARALNRGLLARGHDVVELYLVNASSYPHADPNVIVRSLRPTGGPFHYVRMALLAVSEFRRLKPDVVLCLQWGGNMLGGFAAPFAGRPLVIANQFTLPIVPGPALLVDRVQGTLGAFSRIVVNSRTIEARFGDYPRAYRDRIVRIDHGFDAKRSQLSKSDARSSFGLPQSVSLIGSVGRLAASKNFAAAIKVLMHDKGWHFALCGEGAERSSLLALAESLGCADRVHLLGEMHPDRVGDFLGSLDVFVFPSLAETFGLAAVEAAQVGVPVVANDLAVLREVLAVDGEPCAVFVDTNEEESFAANVSAVLSDKALRARLVTAGRRLSERYGLETMIDAYDRLIDSVLSGQRRD